MSQFHKLKINYLDKNTDQAVVIGFEIPSELKSDFEFKAGQYITIKTELDGNEIRRDYSICSSKNSGDLRVAVKAVSDGNFSKYANSQLKLGDQLDVGKPNGRFIFEPDATSSRTIAAFAAGSGITPIMSITKTLLEEEPESKMILIYGNKTPQDTIFFDELIDLRETYGDRLIFKFVFSQTQEDEALFGRIERSTVNFLLKNDYKDHDIESFYLCGPEPMIHTVSDVLKEFGVAENNIRYELFTTTASTEPSDDAIVDGQTQVKVLLDDEEFEFVMDAKNSVLAAALEEDIDAPYSCQGGICSSCLARITEGSVTMRQNNILTDGEVAEGLILTCQSHPTTSSITIDYDDV